MVRLAFVVATWFGCGYSPGGAGNRRIGAAVSIAIGLLRYFGFVPWHFAVLAVAAVPALPSGRRT